MKGVGILRDEVKITGLLHKKTHRQGKTGDNEWEFFRVGVQTLGKEFELEVNAKEYTNLQEGQIYEINGCLKLSHQSQVDKSGKNRVNTYLKVEVLEIKPIKID